MDNSLSKKIGIVGGGQLGKMMLLEAKKMGFFAAILDPVEDCPAHSISDVHVVAGFNDRGAIRELARQTDVLTYEFEHINADALTELEEEGFVVYPTAKSLKIIQNKFTQKKCLKDANIPVPDFFSVKTQSEIQELGSKMGYPLILKSCTGGYDGKGNYVINEEKEIDAAWTALKGDQQELMIEEFIPFTMEISVLACRGINGQTVVYPVAENEHENNILKQTKVPANISEETTKTAMDIAREVMNVFQGVGMFCVEMFVTQAENMSKSFVLVNEIAPRPHNSGHYTIEACATSQFMQHIRAITGLPLGSPKLLTPSVMRNILSEEGYKGEAIVTGAEETLSLEGVNLHIYGKKTASPNRKMGHITVCLDNIKDCEEVAEVASQKVKIIGTEKL